MRGKEHHVKLSQGHSAPTFCLAHSDKVYFGPFLPKMDFPITLRFPFHPGGGRFLPIMAGMLRLYIFFQYYVTSSGTY